MFQTGAAAQATMALPMGLFQQQLAALGGNVTLQATGKSIAGVLLMTIRKNAEKKRKFYFINPRGKFILLPREVPSKSITRNLHFDMITHPNTNRA